MRRSPSGLTGDHQAAAPNQPDLGDRPGVQANCLPGKAGWCRPTTRLKVLCGHGGDGINDARLAQKRMSALVGALP